MIYDNFKDYFNDSDNCELICCECGFHTNTVFVFWEERRSGKAICTSCVNRHAENRDAGLYPVETGQGIINSDLFLFKKWSEFLEVYGYEKWEIYFNGSTYELRRFSDKLGYAIRNGMLILTDEMIEEFNQIKESIHAKCDDTEN